MKFNRTKPQTVVSKEPHPVEEMLATIDKLNQKLTPELLLKVVEANEPTVPIPSIGFNLYQIGVVIRTQVGNYKNTSAYADVTQYHPSIVEFIQVDGNIIEDDSTITFYKESMVMLERQIKEHRLFEMTVLHDMLHNIIVTLTTLYKLST